MGVTSEHIKYGLPVISDNLLQIVTSIFQKGTTPTYLKEGPITPIHKKGDIQDPAKYRGLPVTSIIEHIINTRHEPILNPAQSKLQSCFTAKLSSINSALIVPECIVESMEKKQPLMLTALDAQRAFDVVDQSIL